MKHAVLICLSMLAGCGVTQNAANHANSVGYGGPDRSNYVHDPTVVIIGDSIVNAWLTPTVLAANPLWTAMGTPAGVVQETTQEVLARFPAAIALHPNIIAIEAGIWDMLLDATDGPPVTTPCDSPQNSCANIQEMISEAQNAGIAVIVCSVPPYGLGPDAVAEESEEYTAHIADILAYNSAIMADSGVSPVDMYSLLVVQSTEEFNVYNPLYTTDGVDPNAAGGAVMTLALQQAIAATKLGSAR